MWISKGVAGKRGTLWMVDRVCLNKKHPKWYWFYDCMISGSDANEEINGKRRFFQSSQRYRTFFQPVHKQCAAFWHPDWSAVLSMSMGNSVSRGKDFPSRVLDRWAQQLSVHLNFVFFYGFYAVNSPSASFNANPGVLAPSSPFCPRGQISPLNREPHISETTSNGLFARCELW